MEKNKKKLLTTIIKIGVSIFLLYFVFTKIPFSEIWLVIQTVNPVYLLLAILFFIASQWVSSKRLLLLFNQKGFYLAESSNHILYLIGMFYNFFIPGGIGGDAYKVYALNKTFQWKAKDLTAAIFIDRFMGLTAIGILVVFLAFPVLQQYGLVWLIPVLLLLGVFSAYFFLRFLFPGFIKVFTPALLYSLVIQLLQVISVAMIILSLDSVEHMLNYLLVFLVSSVLSIFSFSGIGVREFVFYEASMLLGIDTSVAVTVGLLFSVITAGVSLLGIYYHFKGPDLKLSAKKKA